MWVLENNFTENKRKCAQSLHTPFNCSYQASAIPLGVKLCSLLVPGFNVIAAARSNLFAPCLLVWLLSLAVKDTESGDITSMLVHQIILENMVEPTNP